MALPDDTGQERSIGRRLALHVLYEVDSSGHTRGDAIQNQIGYHHVGRKTADYANTLVNGVLDNATALDDAIQAVAEEWPVDQLAIIDRALLRIAVYESAMVQRVPVGVAIDEAVNLAKLYGGDASPRFINGVLGSLFSDVDRLEALLDVKFEEVDEDDDDDDYEYYDDDEEDDA